MNNVNYVDLETAKLLKDIGFDYWCESMYSHNYRVRDEIQEMYPGLSDCGYDDLLTKYGGPLKQTEVFGYYDERIRISSRNSKDYFEHHPNMICACPTFELALEWLRKEKGKKLCQLNICQDIIWLIKTEYMNMTWQSLSMIM